jgi:NTE family protein
VLGAGGVTGIAWLLGALEALERHTRWDPASADVICGTSAGAVAATIAASSTPPMSLLRFADDPDALDAAVRAATAGRAAAGAALPWPGSLALGVGGLVTTDPRHRVVSLAGFLPRGPRSTDEIRGLTHEAVAGGWPSHTRLWLHACDYRSGRRVTFGRGDSPDAELADAVAASCAVPGYYRPVRIGGRHYIDGGLHSFTNADALIDERLDVVVVLSPFASRRQTSLLDTAVFGVARRATAAQLEGEVRELENAGTRVVVVDPTEPELRAMGLNPMERRHSRAVAETAAAGVAARLHELLGDVDLAAARPMDRTQARKVAA